MRYLAMLLAGVSLCSCATMRDHRARDVFTDTEPSPGNWRANAPISVKGNTWYLDVPASLDGPVELYYIGEPASVVDVTSGTPLPFTYSNEKAIIQRPGDGKHEALIAVTWTSDRWTKEMAAFAEADRLQPPATGGTLFLGSSTIVGWDLPRFFPGLNALNRGFGGSDYWDSVYYADRLIRPYKPTSVVLYAGDNDIAGGKSPERVFADFQALVRKIAYHAPDAHVTVVSIKPSNARWDRWDRMKRANELIEGYARTHPKVAYVDIAEALLGPDGKPRAEYFKEDGLHLNDQGYAVCSDLVRPLLVAEEAR